MKTQIIKQSPTLKKRIGLFVLSVLVIIGLLWGGAVLADSARTRQEQAQVAQQLAWMRLIGAGAGLTAVLTLISTTRHLRQYQQLQQTADEQPRAKFSIAVPRDLKSNPVDLWRRLAVYLPREGEFPTQHITFEIGGDRFRIIFAMTAPLPLAQNMREQLIREWPEAQLYDLVKTEAEVAVTKQNRVHPDPASIASPALYYQEWGLVQKDHYPLYQESARRRDTLETFLNAVQTLVLADVVLGYQFHLRLAPPHILQSWRTQLTRYEVTIARAKQAKQPTPTKAIKEKKLLEERLDGVTAVWQLGIRTYCGAPSAELAQAQLERIGQAMAAQMRGTKNGLKVRLTGDKAEVVAGRWFPQTAVALTDTELAQLLHLPAKEVAVRYGKLYKSGSAKIAPTPANIITGAGKEDVILGTFDYETGDRVNVGIQGDNIRKGIAITGGTGAGKSTLLANILIQVIENGWSGLIFDPHIDFMRDVIRNIPPDKLHQVAILDPTAALVPTYNICPYRSDIPPSTTVNNVMDSIRDASGGANWGSSVRMQRIMRHLFLLSIGGLEGRSSIVEVQRLKDDPVYRETALSNISNAIDFYDTVKFWRDEFNQWDENTQISAMSPVETRLSLFTGTPLVRRALGLPFMTMDVPTMLNQGKLIFVPLHPKLEAARYILGSILVKDFYMAMLAREAIPKHERPTTLLCLEEMPAIIGDNGKFFEQLAAEARKYGSAVIGVMQFLGQVSASMQKAVSENFRNKVIMSGNSSSSRASAEMLGGGISPADIQNLPSFTAYAQTVKGGGTTPPCFIETLPPIEPSYRLPSRQKGYQTPPPASWQGLLNPQQATLPHNPKDVPAPELLAYARRLAREEGDGAAAEFVASLPDEETVQALFASNQQYSLWLRQELLANPAMIPDPIKRAYKVSGLKYGLPSWMLDGYFLRMVQSHRPASNVPSTPSSKTNDLDLELEIDLMDF